MTNNKKLNVYYKNVYGNELCYPACKDSKIFASLNGSKTLTNNTILKIKELGYALNTIII